MKGLNKKDSGLTFYKMAVRTLPKGLNPRKKSFLELYFFINQNPVLSILQGVIHTYSGTKTVRNIDGSSAALCAATVSIFKFIKRI